MFFFFFFFFFLFLLLLLLLLFLLFLFSFSFSFYIRQDNKFQVFNIIVSTPYLVSDIPYHTIPLFLILIISNHVNTLYHNGLYKLFGLPLYLIQFLDDYFVCPLVCLLHTFLRNRFLFFSHFLP